VKTTKFGIVLLTLFLSSVVRPSAAHAQTYFIQSQPGAPFPFDPYDGAEPIVAIDATRQIYQVQDNTNDWNMLTTAQELDAMSTTSAMSANSLDPSDTNNIGGGNYTNYFQPSIVFGSNDLWIEILGVDNTNNNQAFLTLHGTIPGDNYQLLSTNLLNSGGQVWTLGEIITGAGSTNQTDFSPFNIDTNSLMFFRAHHGNNEIYVARGQNAIEPNAATGDPGQVGQLYIYSVNALTNDLPVRFTIGGTASNGVDYTYVNGSATIPASQGYTNIDITPIADSLVEGVETVTITLGQSNTYLIAPDNITTSISIEDSSTFVGLGWLANAVEPDGPPTVAAQVGTLQFFRNDERNLYPPMRVYYTVSGTASNGVDYTLLTNSLVFPQDIGTVYLDVNPLDDSVLEGTETVTVTLVATNTYVVNTNSFTQTVFIADSSTTVGITLGQDSIETNATLQVGQVGIFNVHREDTRGEFPQMTVNYQISGTASNGVDYQTLSGTVTLASGTQDTNIFIQTLPDVLIEGNETVVLALVPNSDAYYIDTNATAATNTILDSVAFLTVASLSNPIGLDYYAPSNFLLVSYNYASGSPFNFARIYTNLTTSGGVPVTNVVTTNWSGVNGVFEEVKIATIRMPAGILTNSAGFTNGDLFFGSSTGIGYVSAASTRSNLNWCVLTNSVETNALLLRGSLCVDQTGTFSNNIIAVTSSDDDTVSPKGVWQVNSKANPRLLAQINTEHLEGVTTLTNDTAKWGPWAGKIITGDEAHADPVTFAADPVIYTISTNGTVATYHTLDLISSGIHPEDFDVIPTNQNLYLTAFNQSKIMELPAENFSDHVGDLLITDAGESGPVGLYIVHWNGSNFITTSIPIPNSVGGHIEHVTFAPIRLPGQ
jgi:hypothetical protein